MKKSTLLLMAATADPEARIARNVRNGSKKLPGQR